MNMPTSEERKRGIKYWRTIHPKGHPEEYLHIAVLKTKGKRGGTTLAGKVREKMYA